MTSFKKLVMCFGLFAVLALPLSGCGSTWQGIKNDWHDATSSNDDGSAMTQTASEEAPTEAAKTVSTDDETPSAYN